MIGKEKIFGGMMIITVITGVYLYFTGVLNFMSVTYDSGVLTTSVTITKFLMFTGVVALWYICLLLYVLYKK